MKHLNDVTRRRFLGVAAVGVAAAATHAWAAGRTRTSYQVGCYTRCFDQFDLRTALDGIAEAGYKNVGIMTAKGTNWVVIRPETTPEEAAGIGADVKQRGLTTISVYGDFAVKDGVEKGVAGLKRLIDNCRACGCSNLLIGGTTDEKLFENYYKAVEEACDYAAEKEVTLSIKPHGGQNATGPDCRRILAKVHKRNFRLWYDPGNIFYYSDGKLDPAEDCQSVDGLVTGVSVKDFTPPKEVLLTPGTGRVDFVTVLRRLRKGGFVEGPLVVECVKRGDLKSVVEQARLARVYLEDVIRQARG